MKLTVIPPAATGEGIIEQIERKRSAMKVTNLAELLGFSRTTIYEWIDRGELAHFNIDGAIRLDPKEVAGFLRSRWIPALSVSCK